jgi:hypothetical protein
MFSFRICLMAPVADTLCPENRTSRLEIVRLICLAVGNSNDVAFARQFDLFVLILASGELAEDFVQLGKFGVALIKEAAPVPAKREVNVTPE